MLDILTIAVRESKHTCMYNWCSAGLPFKKELDLVVSRGVLYSVFWKETSGLYLGFIKRECKCSFFLPVAFLSILPYQL